MLACGSGNSNHPIDAGADAGDAGSVDASLDAGSPPDAADAEAPDADVDAGPPGLYFEDLTESAGLSFDHRPWPFGLPERLAGGVCALDVDGAPPLDLFFAMRHGFEGDSRMYVGDGPVHFRDATREAGLRGVRAMSCLAFDIDGDGDDDLLVAGEGGPRLFENAGGHFVEHAERLVFSAFPLDLFTGIAAGDVDGDGDIDLFVGGYAFIDPAVCADAAPADVELCESQIQAYTFIPDLLLIQGDDGVFHDQAATLAPDLLRTEPGLVVAIADLDGDQQQDLFLGNDLGSAFTNRALIRGSDGHFTDRAPYLGVDWTFDGNGIDSMAFSMADLDDDGLLDFVVTGFEHQPTAVYLRDASGNYDDHADTVGTIAGRESFRVGAALVDVDLDGHPDLVEATGHYFTDAEIMLRGVHGPEYQPANLFLGVSGGRLVAPPLLPGDGLLMPRVSRGVSVVDLDDDGRPDVVFAPSRGQPALLHNVARSLGEPLVITLHGRPPNVEAAGAHVEVHVAGRVLVRDRILGEGYLGNFERRFFFGVPRGSTADVSVRWPDGTVITRTSVPAGTRLELNEM